MPQHMPKANLKETMLSQNGINNAMMHTQHRLDNKWSFVEQHPLALRQ